MWQKPLPLALAPPPGPYQHSLFTARGLANYARLSHVNQHPIRWFHKGRHRRRKRRWGRGRGRGGGRDVPRVDYHLHLPGVTFYLTNQYWGPQ